MRSHVFKCKQFDIQQDRCAMKVCTDAMFLGAVAEVNQATSVLDIGTGTGLLALMIAQRQAEANIFAIEIEENAFTQAQENINRSKFKEKIKVINADIKLYEHEGFEMIVSNPPFYQASLLPTSQPNLKAHHAQTLNFPELIIAVDRLLKPSGVFNVLLPTFEFEQFQKMMQEHGFRLKKRLNLKNSSTKPIFRVVGIFDRTYSKKTIVEEVVIYDDEPTIYSAGFREKMKDFYIIF